MVIRRSKMWHDPKMPKCVMWSFVAFSLFAEKTYKIHSSSFFISMWQFTNETQIVEEEKMSSRSTTIHKWRGKIKSASLVFRNSCVFTHQIRHFNAFEIDICLLICPKNNILLAKLTPFLAERSVGGDVVVAAVVNRQYFAKMSFVLSKSLFRDFYLTYMCVHTQERFSKKQSIINWAIRLNDQEINGA